MAFKVIYDAQKPSGEWKHTKFYEESLRKVCKRIKKITERTVKGQADIYYTIGYEWIHTGQKIW